MNNFKSAALFAAASLSALSIGAALPALAQTDAPTTSPAAVSPTSIRLQKSTVAQFSAQYHVPVVQDTTPMVERPLDSTPPTDRLRDLQKLAVESGVTWRKVYRVSPATIDNPVTTLAGAERMVDQPAQVTLSTSGIPEAAAFRTVAAADNAIVKYTGGAAARDISVNLSGSTLPQAIAALARQTNTHWQSVYLLAPVLGDSQTPTHLAYAARPALMEQQWEPTRYNDGPFTIHFAYPPEPVTVASSAGAPSTATPASSQPGANSDATPGQQNGAGLNPADPNAANPAASGYSSPYQASPYGPFGGYNPYGYTDPSLTVGGSITATPFYGYGNGASVAVGGSVVSQ